MKAIHGRSGKILLITNDNNYDCDGVDSLIFVEIEGKTPLKVDVTKTPKVMTYEDLPISEVDKMKADIDFLLALNGGVK